MKNYIDYAKRNLDYKNWPEVTDFGLVFNSGGRHRKHGWTKAGPSVGSGKLQRYLRRKYSDHHPSILKLPRRGAASQLFESGSRRNFKSTLGAFNTQ